MKCDTCNAPKWIKESLGCNGDRLFNAFEVFKAGVCEMFKIKYTPRFECRFADLIESIEKERAADED